MGWLPLEWDKGQYGADVQYLHSQRRESGMLFGLIYHVRLCICINFAGSQLTLCAQIAVVSWYAYSKTPRYQCISPLNGSPSKYVFFHNVKSSDRKFETYTEKTVLYPTPCRCTRHVRQDAVAESSGNARPEP